MERELKEATSLWVSTQEACKTCANEAGVGIVKVKPYGPIGHSPVNVDFKID